MAACQLQLAVAGDSQGLKACIAAAAAGTALEIVVAGGAAGGGASSSSSSSRSAAAGGATSPGSVVLWSDGLQLSEPNAAALYLSGEW
jgi:hypothetical protein